MKQVLLFGVFITTLCASCKNKDVEKQGVIDRYVRSLDNDGVAKFEIGECKQDCALDSGGLISIQLNGDLLKIKLNHWMNCLRAEYCTYELDGNVLYLNLQRKPVDYEVKSNGDTSFIYSAAACNCLFNMSFELTGFKQLPDDVFINRQDIKNYLGPRFGD